MSTHVRHNRRKTLIGFVTSRSGDKSVKVTIPYKTPHPLYHKVVNRQTVVHAPDEKNATKDGATVDRMETRPHSPQKPRRIINVVERAVAVAPEAITEKDVAETVPTKTVKEPAKA